VLLERDENFPEPAELERELAEIRRAVEAGASARAAGHVCTEGLTRGRPAEPGDAAARQRLGLAQAALLSALVAGTPVPEGFDRARLRIQSRALAAKRADVVAKVAPELPVLLGDGYRPAFLAYAQRHPMTGGYRQDAMTFAGDLLKKGELPNARVRRKLQEWWLDRSGPTPPPRLARAARKVLLRR
jgi:hypothetical protein